jgi:acyl-CoA dehydrogenase
MTSEAVDGGLRRRLFDDDHESYRESVRTHLERTVVPAAEVWDAAGAVPADALRAAAEHGFTGTGIPEEHGGLGLDDIRFPAIVVAEAMRAGVPAFALVLAAHDDVPVRALRGSPLGSWLQELAAGTSIATTVLHGRVIARRHRGTTVLDGAAEAVVNGVGADILVVVATGEDGPVVAAVRRDAPGVAVAATPPPIGLRAAGLADVALADVQIQDSQLLASGDAAASLLRELEAGERLLLAVAAAAGARAALDITLAYVRDRRAFGQPIASFQNTRQMLGEVAADLAAAEALVDACLEERVAGRLTPERAAAAKLHATQVHGRAVDAGVQLHGGYGYIMEYAIAGAFADARFLRLHGGTSEEMRDAVAASLSL